MQPRRVAGTGGDCPLRRRSIQLTGEALGGGPGAKGQGHLQHSLRLGGVRGAAGTARQGGGVAAVGAAAGRALSAAAGGGAAGAGVLLENAQQLPRLFVLRPAVDCLMLTFDRNDSIALIVNIAGHILVAGSWHCSACVVRSLPCP